MSARAALVGQDIERGDDAPLLTGAARFVDDLDRPGQLYARVVRSTVAHGRLIGVDSEQASRVPGVVAVFTAEDVPDVRIPIRLPLAETPQAARVLQPPLARDRVRYVGEPVALVVADDPWVAEDAAELVDVQVEPLPAVLDVVSAAEEPPVHGDVATNVVNTIPLRYGDVEAAFARASVVVRDRLSVNRVTGLPLETRGLLAEYDHADGRVTVWGPTKVVYFNRMALSQMLGLEPDRVRCLEVAVGGGFGVRGEFYPEDLLIPFAAIQLRRPVKWIEDRREHLTAINHGREQVHEIEVAADSDGTLLAFRDRAWADQGAYVRTQGILPCLLPALSIAGPYAWQAFEVESTGVLTNHTPVGTVRAPGVTEATFARERMIDRVAAELGLDPAAVRRQNLISAEAMPFVFDFGPHADPLVYESGDFPKFFERVLTSAGYEQLRAQQRSARERGEAFGIGISAFTEVTAVGPFEDAQIAPDGDLFDVRVGVSSLGQGVVTALTQIAADALGVGLDQVRITHDDSDVVPQGFGAFSSRSTVLAGNAIALAAQDLRHKAAQLLGEDEATIDLAAHITALAGAGCRGEGRFEKEHPSFSFGANLTAVTVDTGTGRVKVLRHLVAYDVGRAVNPAMLKGQIAGGAAQGIGGALYEHLAYDQHGQPLSTTLDDYLLPTAADLPEIEVIILEHPTPTNPLGIKGGGESGVAGTFAAVANAVADALGTQTINHLPLTPGRLSGLDA